MPDRVLEGKQQANRHNMIEVLSLDYSKYVHSFFGTFNRGNKLDSLTKHNIIEFYDYLPTFQLKNKEGLISVFFYSFFLF